MAWEPRTPLPPTHKLRVKEREGKGTNSIGVGWLNKDGSMRIHLNPCVVLSWTDDVHITLFPIGTKKENDHEQQDAEREPPFK
jgi:hypothetical protein